MLIQIAAVIVVVCCLVVVGFLIPLLIQLRKTAEKVQVFAEDTNRELSLILKDAQAAAAALKQSTLDIKTGIQRGSVLLAAVKGFAGQASSAVALFQGISGLVQAFKARHQGSNGKRQGPTQ